MAPMNSDWSPTTSSSTQSFDYDFHDEIGRRFGTFLNETYCHESSEKRKRRIPKLNPSKSPHCCKHISSKRLKYAILLYRIVDFLLTPIAPISKNVGSVYSIRTYVTSAKKNLLSQKTSDVTGNQDHVRTDHHQHERLHARAERNGIGRIICYVILIL